MKSFTILSGKAHVVELPEGARLFEIVRTYWGDDRGCDRLRWSYPKQGQKWLETGEISLPPGTWQIVGMLSEITEEQAAGMVAWVETGQYYVDYRVDGWWNGDITALESLESAILAEGYYLDENPIPEPDISRYPNDDWIADYNNAQSRVLSRERCLLLMRVDV